MTLSEFHSLPDGTRVYSGENFGTVLIGGLGTAIVWHKGGATLIKTEKDIEHLTLRNSVDNIVMDFVS